MIAGRAASGRNDPSLAVKGSLLLPGTQAYEAARRVWNARIDRRPAAIARCTSARDVASAMRLARANGLGVTVRGAGHNAAGRAVRDGALMLDLSPMRQIEVDPEGWIVRAQAGATWGELDQATAEHGLATTGARISSVGIAGVTLGGGYGWLMRMHGLTIDNVRAIDVITADGSSIRASADQHPDLFWALRGGGTLAVATSFEYTLHPVAKVTCGVAYYATDLAQEVVDWYRRRMETAPDELTILFNLVIAPHAPFVPPHVRGTNVAALTIAHFGPVEQAQSDLETLHELGPPLVMTLKPRRYTTLQRLFDAAGLPGNCVYGRAGHLPTLEDGLIDVLANVRLSSPLSTVMLAPLGGAVARAVSTDTAFCQRGARFDCSIEAVSPACVAFGQHARWADELWSAVRPFTSGAYVNELGEGEDERVSEAYDAPTAHRLAVLASAYDPDGLLCTQLPVYRVSRSTKHSGFSNGSRA